ncbi:MAG TPA: phosphopantetheine-binding protein [Chitinophagaceae bacterium]|nr:phosphopantetheine-binding protein [Chitinophagaceae bacterium]
MTRQEVKDKIVEILKTVPTLNQKNLDNITEDTDLITDLGAPSTEIVNIIAKAEEKFGFDFEDDDVDNIGSTVGDTINLILKYADKKDEA